jgi:UDP-N-acetylglucosamine 2-epimerase
MLLAADSPAAISASMGLGGIGFAQVYDRVRPDLLLVLGDRFEMHAAAAGGCAVSHSYRSCSRRRSHCGGH